MDFLGGLIGAIGTIIFVIVIVFILGSMLWYLIFNKDKGDSSGNDDGGGYGSHGGSL